MINYFDGRLHTEKNYISYLIYFRLPYFKIMFRFFSYIRIDSLDYNISVRIFSLN